MASRGYFFRGLRVRLATNNCSVEKAWTNLIRKQKPKCILLVVVVIIIVKMAYWDNKSFKLKRSIKSLQTRRPGLLSMDT